MSAVYGEDKRGKGAVLVIQSKVMCLGCFGGKMEGGGGGGGGGVLVLPAEACSAPIRPEPSDCRESSLKPMSCLGAFFPLSLLGLPFIS